MAMWQLKSNTRLDVSKNATKSEQKAIFGPRSVRNNLKPWVASPYWPLQRKSIQASENEQRQFKEFVAGSKAFSPAEKAAIEFNSMAKFNAEWARVNTSKSTFDHNHEKGVGLAARKYQESAGVVIGFMDSFSPILEIVKDFAAPYGGMAIGVISILFTVLPKTLKSFSTKLTFDRWQKIKTRLKNDYGPQSQLFRIGCQVSRFISVFTTMNMSWISSFKAESWRRIKGSSTSQSQQQNITRIAGHVSFSVEFKTWLS
jgi:hypothetical protein